MALTLGLPAATVEEGVKSLIGAVFKLLKELDMPLAIADLGIDPVTFKGKIPEMAERAFADQTITTNPRFPLVSELADLYRLAYGLPLSLEVSENLLDFSLLRRYDLRLPLYRAPLWEGEERPQSAPRAAH